ncbi:hypothetical protein HispidOSU_017129, partial [Sigmodon hispidus]
APHILCENIDATHQQASVCKWNYEIPQFPVSGTLSFCLKKTALFFQLSLTCLPVYSKSLQTLRNSRVFQSESLYHLLVNINYDAYHCLCRCLRSIYEQGFIFTEA